MARTITVPAAVGEARARAGGFSLTARHHAQALSSRLAVIGGEGYYQLLLDDAAACPETKS